MVEDPSPAVSSPQIPQPATPESAPESPISFNIGEEYGTAKKNLPPIEIVLLAIGVVGIVSAIMVLIQRPHSETAGAITDVVAVDVPGQNITMVALNVSLQNRGGKPYWIKTIKAALDTSGGHFPDDAASAVDFERYFAAFPPLKEHVLPALMPETRIEPGGTASGTVVVSFPVTADVFANRKSLSVMVQPYEGVPLVITK
jgi:hypothetical protein